MLAGCTDDNDFVAPSFLHIEAIKVVPPTSNPVTVDEGFYTSDIRYCYVTAHYPEATKDDTIGLFQLPFTIPILHNGPVEWFEIHPAIMMSGLTGQLPYYTFYQRVKVTDLQLVPGDTLRIDTVKTTYNLTRDDVPMYEPFEPTEGSILFDSVEWHQYEPDEACTGNGYASVHVTPETSHVPFSIKHKFYVSDSRKVVYMELDTRSDVPYELFMRSAYTSGGSTDVQGVMVITPSDHWQHLYINLGRTWEWFNYNPDFELIFSALNVDGIEGDVRIDNVKVITTSQVL